MANSRTAKTHRRGFWGYPVKRYRPACGAAPGEPRYANEPTCERCQLWATHPDSVWRARVEAAKQ